MFRADLWALRNLFRTEEGRKVLFGNAVVVGCLVLASLAISARFFLAPDVVAAVADDATGELASLYYAATLLLPILALLGLGVTQLGNELYKAPQLQVLLSAPVSSLAIVLRAYARSVGTWMLFCVAIGLPPVLGIAQRSQLAGASALAYPLAALALIAPIVAAQTLAKVVLARWFGGQRVRTLLTSLYVGVCIAMGLLVAIGFFSGEAAGARARELLQSDVELPWLLAAPASWLAWAAGFEPSAPSLFSNPAVLALLALPLPLLALSASLYRASYEAFWVAGKASWRRARVGRRPWPATPFRSFLAKSHVESLRVRSNLVTLAVIALLMVVLLKNGAGGAPAPEGSPVPEALRQGFQLLFTWYVLVLLVACLCFAAVVGDEQKQIALLAGAPFARRELLKAKLVGIAGPFALCLAIVLALGVPVAGVEPAAIGVVALAAPPIVLFVLGVIAAVGTWPVAVRVHDEVPLANNLRSILPVLLISGAGLLGMLALFEAKRSITAACHGYGWLESLGGTRAALVLLGATWWVGAVVCIYGCRLALANLERVLGPQ